MELEINYLFSSEILHDVQKKGKKIVLESDFTLNYDQGLWFSFKSSSYIYPRKTDGLGNDRRKGLNNYNCPNVFSLGLHDATLYVTRY